MKEKLSFHQHHHLLVEEMLQTCLHTMKVVTAMNDRDSDDDIYEKCSGNLIPLRLMEPAYQEGECTDATSTFKQNS